MKAKPGIIEYTQGDGTVVEIMLHGDEHSHFATTPDGRPLRLDEKGCYVAGEQSVSGRALAKGLSANHSQILSASHSAGHSPRYSPARYRYSSSAFPTTGAPHSLVVLVEYPDYAFSMEDPLEYFEDFLNGADFSRDGATGSCRQFFVDNSGGAFSPTFDVYGPVMMKNKRRFYGAGNEENACQMVVEAVEALDAEVDFSIYDHNDDGYVDSIYIIYAEKGQNDGGNAEAVWPYSWELEEEGVDLRADGVKFNTYGCSNELKGNGGVNGIGTFTHEFGHVLGLPDLYNTQTSSDNTTPSDWSTMDSGNYNNGSRTPPNLSAFERYSLGWLDPHEILGSRDYSLAPLGVSNKAYMMTTEEDPDEFFLVEYRRKEGWDAFLPAEGMLVWRCEFVQSIWDNNTVNNNRNHHYVELLRADNEKLTTQNSYLGDPFPGSKGVTELSRDTRPALKSWHANRSLNAVSLTGIREDDGAVYFTATVEQERVPTGVESVTEDGILKVEGGVMTVDRGAVSVYDIAGRLVGVVTPERPLAPGAGLYIAGKKAVAIR